MVRFIRSGNRCARTCDVKRRAMAISASRTDGRSRKARTSYRHRHETTQETKNTQRADGRNGTKCQVRGRRMTFAEFAEVFAMLSMQLPAIDKSTATDTPIFII